MDPKRIQVLPEERKEKRRMLSCLKKNKGLLFYCLTDSKDGIMEVMPAWSYRLSQREDRLLLGVATTRTKALELLEKMIGDMYRDTGTFDVRGYYG